MAEELCTHCGAPRVAGYASCKFCKTPFASVGNTQTGAIPCPRCNTLNELGAQKCVECQAWIVVQCVFCGALSPHNVPACQRCNEPFAGAPQRLAERQRAQHLQTGLNVASTVGTVAASFLGAAAGAGMFSGSHHDYAEPPHGGHHHRGYEGEGDWVQTGAGISQSSDSGGGFLDNLFGGSTQAADGAGDTDIEGARDDDGDGVVDDAFDGDGGTTDAGISVGGDDGGGDDYDS